MIKYSNLKQKWQNIHCQEKAFRWSNYQAFTPGVFCVTCLDCGFSGPCGSAIIETTGFFDSAQDALAFYRFTQIPRILSWITGHHSEKIYKDAEYYLSELDDGIQTVVKDLLEHIDYAIETDRVTPVDLEKIQTEYNGLFDDTNPRSQILAWGSLHDILLSDHCVDAFVEDKENEVKSSITLSELVSSSEVDENNSDHLALAVEFLKKHEVC